MPSFHWRLESDSDAIFESLSIGNLHRKPGALCVIPHRYCTRACFVKLRCRTNRRCREFRVCLSRTYRSRCIPLVAYQCSISDTCSAEQGVYCELKREAHGISDTIRGLMPTVRLDKVSLSFGLKPLLDDAALQIRRGERVCLLGRNGEGKSSLLQLITRNIVPDSGEVWVRPGAKVASLAQEVSPASDQSVLDVVMSGAAVGGIDGDWQAALQVDQVISRLELDRDAPMSALSGGWRRRVMLGRALVSDPDLLLLDEPTNHLDIDAITWLEDMMIEFKGALLFISHDRAFVRRLATRIVELDRGQLRQWPGNYDDYVLQKRAALEVEAKHAALFDKKLAQEEVWIRKGVQARRTRNEGRVRALEQLRIQRRERRERIGTVELRAQDAPPSGKLVFEAKHVTHSFGAAP